MAKVLIIGPSGAGKTYLSKELRKLGLNSVDADSLKELHSWHDSQGNKVIFPRDAEREFLENHSFLWNKNVLVKYLKENPDVYLFGASGNIFDMTDLFDKVFYLDVPGEVVEDRLQHENRKNPMGKTEYQRRNAVEWAKELRTKARELKLKFIDGTQMPEVIYKQLREKT